MKATWFHRLGTVPVSAMLLVMAACSLGDQRNGGLSSSGGTILAAEGRRAFEGVIKRGAELGGVKDYCSEGLYLVADEGFLVGQTRMLLLRLPATSAPAKMLSDQLYIDKKVEVVGKYPAQEVFCEALMCECDDYILVEQIDIR